MTKFKVGDKVKVNPDIVNVDGRDLTKCVGTVSTISQKIAEVSWQGMSLYRGHFEEMHGSIWWVYLEDLQPLEKKKLKVI